MEFLKRLLERKKPDGADERSRRWLPLVVLAGLCGIALIGLSSCQPKDADESLSTGARQTAEAYCEAMETKLEKTLSGIGGTGSVKVMITLEQGTEYIYATEEKGTGDTSASSSAAGGASGEKSSEEKTFFTVDTGEGEEALIVTERAPKIKGVVVVCSGAANSAVYSSVRSAVMTLLGVDEENVCVVMHS